MKITSMLRISAFLVMVECLVVAEAADQVSEDNHWDYRPMPQEQIAFFDEHIPAVVDLYKAKGMDVALEALDKVWVLAEEEGLGTYYLHRAIWFEAQAYSGKQDQEWGFCLFEYLFDKKITNNPDRSNAVFLQPLEYIYCGNIIECCQSLGKAALSREYSLKVEESLKGYMHFDLTGESYTDEGPIFSFLDDARKREFPIYRTDIDIGRILAYAEGNGNFFYYPTIYGIRFVSDTAMRSGDWKKAAELSAWCIRYANQYLSSQTLMIEEINLQCLYESYKTLSDLALLHGYPDEAARFMEEYLECSKAFYEKYTNQRCDLLHAKLDLAVIQILTGELPDNVLEMAAEAAELMESNWYYGRMLNMGGHLNKARILYALNQPEAAWEIVDGLMAKVADDANPQYWLTMLDTAIDLALADGAVRSELEDWLILALDNARQMGNKFKELPLYEKYARFLFLKGRYSEAVQIQQEAVRLAMAMNLPKRQADNSTVLADMKQNLGSEDSVVEDTSDQQVVAAHPNSAVSETERPDAVVIDLGTITSAHPVEMPIAVDIQPRASLSSSLKGQGAYGRFYVYNPAATAQSGTLRLIGPIDRIKWEDGRRLSVGSCPVFKDTEWSQEIRLAAGTSCIIDITGLPDSDTEEAVYTCQCQWIPNGDESAVVSGIWEYQTSETEKRTAVIDAHELQDNPFYLIPIHHMIQRLDIAEEQIVDFSVEASSPARIESYDAYSGTLLSVDANGDGDFQDGGDMVSGDSNGNNWPDLTFKKRQRLSSLVLYVQPGAKNVNDDTELTVRIRTEDGWQTDAVDVIKPGGNKK